MSGVSPIRYQTYYPVDTSVTTNLINQVKSGIQSVHMMNSAVSDMNSRKTGAYGGLLQAYYGKHNPLRPNKGLYSQFESASNTPVALEVRARAAKLSDTTNKLSGKGYYSVFEKDELRDTEGRIHAAYNKRRIFDTLRDYADDYNKTMGAATASSDEWMKASAANMRQLTHENKEDLYNIGINVDYNGRMHVNETKFMEADMNDVTRLFGNQFGYVAKVGSSSSNMENRISNIYNKLTYTTYGRNGYYQGRSGPGAFDMYA